MSVSFCVCACMSALLFALMELADWPLLVCLCVPAYAQGSALIGASNLDKLSAAAGRRAHVPATQVNCDSQLAMSWGGKGSVIC